jgi:hypothetical protein
MKKNSEKGAVIVEFSLILPLLLILVFAITDFGRLFYAGLIVTNVCREGGSLASRRLMDWNELIDMLQASAVPLDLHEDGRIYLTRIRAGTGIPEDRRYPRIAEQLTTRGIAVQSNVRGPNLGLTEAMFSHLEFNEENSTSDISELTVVEVFYLFRPITPLPRFIKKLFSFEGRGLVIGSRIVMQSVKL